MLTRDGCLKRRDRLWRKLPGHIQWVLVTDPRHVTYFSGFWVNPVSFSFGERAFLYLSRNGNALLLADNFTLGSAGSSYFVDDELAGTWYDKLHEVRNRDHVLLDLLSSLPVSATMDQGILETEWLPQAAPIRGREEYSLGTAVRELRRRKEEDELQLLARCIRAGDAGHERAREIVKPGVTEREVYLEVQRRALEELGAPGVVYGDFRAVNAGNPKQGGLPTDYVLREGDLFILDYSVSLGGYRSDTTNTIAVSGPTDEQKKLFDDCVNALKAGEEKLIPGTPAKDIFAAAEQYFLNQGYEPSPPRHMGHGLGLGHPEPPIFVSESSDVIAPGDVVTLEPARYIPGVGGVRVEHNYLITDDGLRQLSGHRLAL